MFAVDGGGVFVFNALVGGERLDS